MEVNSYYTLRTRQSFMEWSDQAVKLIEQKGKTLFSYVEPFMWFEHIEGEVLDLVYEEGTLKRALLRGSCDLTTNITANAVLLRGVPRKINASFTGGVTGSVYGEIENIRELLLCTDRDHAKACERLTFSAVEVQPTLLESQSDVFLWAEDQGFGVPLSGKALSPGDVINFWQQYITQIYPVQYKPVTALCVRFDKHDEFDILGVRSGRRFGGVLCSLDLVAEVLEDDANEVL